MSLFPAFIRDECVYRLLYRTNSTGNVAAVVRNTLSDMKNSHLLRALHLAVVVSPVCLFGEYMAGHTTSKRVTQTGLVDVRCMSFS